MEQKESFVGQLSMLLHHTHGAAVKKVVIGRVRRQGWAVWWLSSLSSMRTSAGHWAVGTGRAQGAGGEELQTHGPRIRTTYLCASKPRWPTPTLGTHPHRAWGAGAHHRKR